MYCWHCKVKELCTFGAYRLVTMENIVEVTKKITNRIAISSSNATSSIRSDVWQSMWRRHLPPKFNPVLQCCSWPPRYRNNLSGRQ